MANQLFRPDLNKSKILKTGNLGTAKAGGEVVPILMASLFLRVNIALEILI